MLRSLGRLLIRVLLDSIVVFAVILLIPGIPPYVKFEEFSVAPSRKLVEELGPNQILDKAEPLLPPNHIVGPESIAIRKGTLYTGIIGGHVIRVHDDHKGYTVVAKFGKECEGKWEESLCGRPLGMRFDSSGKLVVADAYYGVFRVDVDNGKVETLVNSDVEVEGKKQRCINDLDIGSDGSIYYSDSSTNVPLQSTVHEFLGEASGRLMKWDPIKNTSTVLISGVRFANGVQLSAKEDAVFVSETAMARVLKYHLKGERKGSWEVFIEGLPGSPDNIRSNGKGGLFVSLIVPRSPQSPMVTELLGPWPLARKLILRLFSIAEITLTFFENLLPNMILKQAIYYIGHLEPVALLLPRHPIIVELDERGEILDSLQGLSGSIAHISEITLDETGRVGYLGSPYNSNIYRVKFD